ncbi:immune inhibitor A peptidase M6 [Nonomuraea polychroma]|uniref:Zinc carboxypeptidase n=1 Tax=Nonomuraea polychroma TaxID=46176 RepID=A0A438MEP4_9ACTN|nr:M14 family metallopeptidase [Nonomuraea polychroma]RVX44197.1 immune inhibitor A peptidase M6 [Nonomuraea polychroma]
MILGLGTSLVAIATPSSADPLPPSDQIELYQLESTPGTSQTLREKGFDVVQHETKGDKEHVELTAAQADLAGLKKLGYKPEPVRNPQGQTQLQAAKAQASGGYTVWKSYSEPGGIADQLKAIANANKDIVKLQSIGKSVQGKDILAAKVTTGARVLPDGLKPSTLFSATQHAREWITTEVDMRLLKYVIANKTALKDLLNKTELWFVPVANPDGYDFTFTEGNRLWRKNLRDNNGDGKITIGDGVDPNRNFPTNFHYDEEGSSSVTSSDTYRGSGPASEPETKAMDGLLKRVGFEMQLNYHSYGPLLLYPIGFQIATETADNPIYEALTGTDDKPAVPGFDPDLGAELYTTNGDTNDQAHFQHGTLSWTPELNEGCDGCGFVFPDAEALVQAEFEKNLPFALDVAKSAVNPAEPVSHLGNKTPDFVLDPFEVSHGKDQVVQVNAKRKLGPVFLNYQVNGGRTKTVLTGEWKGGERYGKGYNRYYHWMRGKITGTEPGDKVKVWFTSIGKKCADFTYTVAADIGGQVLVLATEDVTGISPVQGVTEAKYADEYAAALTAAGYTSDVYDMDKMGRKAPHPLGVLSHYKAVVWETGDDIIPRSTGQVPGTTSKGGVDTELAVRDYLNEGGKLLHAGKFASYAANNNGAYYYEPDQPAQSECTVADDPPCIPVFNDFQQYYLGAYVFFDDAGTDHDTGQPYPLTGNGGRFDGFNATLEPSHTNSFVATSAILPAQQFPLFESSAQVKWVRPGGPFDPHTGAWDVYSGIADVSWKRLTKTIDLTGKTSGDLSFWTSYDTEAAWDFLTVEARTAGGDDWTTLPDANGHTTQETGDSCLTESSGGWRTIHPFTQRYQGVNCEPTGTSGSWHAASGNSAGWQQWKIDLTPYAGKQVELSISYISDWATQGAGVFLDDFKVTLDGATAEETSFESDLGGWTVGAPPGGTSTSINNWFRTDQVFEEGGGIVTKDTVYLGFGAESITDQATRTDLIKRSMLHLLGDPR